MRLAIIDLGTNSARFAVFDCPGGSAPIRVFTAKERVRLGNNLFATKRLDSDASKRALTALARYAKLAKKHGAEAIHAVATSALREALDGREFAKLVLKETGIELRIISGAEEARLIAQGIMALCPGARGKLLLVDIGGGSTELSLCNDGKVLSSHSFDLGAARCQQLFLKTIPPTAGPNGTTQALRSHLKSSLKSSEHPFRSAALAIGSSGSIRALVKMYWAASGLDTGPMPTEFLTNLVQRMETMTLGELKKLPGLDPKRVDIVLAAAIVLEELLLAFKVPELEATPYGLTEGVLIAAIQKATIPG